MKKKLFTLLLAGMLLTACGQSSQSIEKADNLKENTSEKSDVEESQDSEEAYILEFEAPTIDGETLSSDCFSNSKLTMLNVWATYCNPCLAEMPDLGELAAEYDAAEFQIVGIISDVAEDADKLDIENAKDLIEETQANYPHLLLNQSLYTNLVGQVSSVPTTFFVNQKGEVLGYIVGANSKEAWEEIINDLLEKNP